MGVTATGPNGVGVAGGGPVVTVTVDGGGAGAPD
jgi:hypothetical protein